MINSEVIPLQSNGLILQNIGVKISLFQAYSFICPYIHLEMSGGDFIIDSRALTRDINELMKYRVSI